MTGTGRSITKDDIVFLYRGIEEIEDKVKNHDMPFGEVISAFKVLLDLKTEGIFLCPECGAEWSCSENRCTAQCGKSRQ